MLGSCCHNYNATTSMSNNPWYPPPGPSYNFIVDNGSSSSNSREMRNRAEKMRRDKLNSFIGELGALVPMISCSAKRMDKTSILRLAATHLRIHQSTLLTGREQRMELPRYIHQFHLEQLMQDQMSGFLLVLVPPGKIVFVSCTVEHLLGHLQTDLLGQSIYSITAPDDHNLLKLHINASLAPEQEESRRQFSIRIKRAGPRSEAPVYEPVRVFSVRRSDNNQSSSRTNTNALNKEILTLFIRIIRPEPIGQLLIEAMQEQYISRHLIDGRIIDCDQRISLVAGYMTDEVSGLSAFKFMHREDVRWVMIALRQMYDQGVENGGSCYRLQSKTGEFIYLQTSGYLEPDSTGTVESFVCINMLVDEEIGRAMIKEMKTKFSALIEDENYLPRETDWTDSEPSVEDPRLVDAALIHLITDLPTPSSDLRSIISPLPLCNVNENQDCIISTEPFPKPPYQVKLKTANKRPALFKKSNNNNYKRLKTSPILPMLIPPFENTNHIGKEMPNNDSPRYQHEQML